MTTKAKTAPAKSPAKRTAVKSPSSATQLSPVHGKYEHLAELALWTTKNSLDGEVPIFGHVNVGPILIDASNDRGHKYYQMFIRCARLQLSCEGFEALPEIRRYRRVLAREEARAHGERISKEESNSGWKAKVIAHLNLKWLSVDGGIGRGRKKSAKQTDKIEASVEVTLVQNLPNLSWRIGDPELGDLRKLQGFLEGDYLYHDCPTGDALCHVRALATAGQRKVTASLSVSIKNGVHVVPDGGYASDAGIGDNERDGEFSRAFKDRLRSLSLSKGLEGRDHFEIARHQLAETPAREGDP